MSKPEVAVFTRDNPCNKLILWNCFRTRRGFKKIQVDEAKAQIGENAPKNMLKNEYVVVVESRNVEYYQLTEEGKFWLKTGMAGFVKRYPEEAGDAVYLPKSIAA
jgi:hypothetical protein